MPLSLSHSTIEGYQALELNTRVLGLTVLPELGGKLASLRDLRTGREWLWRHPRMAYQKVPYGTTYVHTADTGGWDECFPTVAQCTYPDAPWMGTLLQDHGELWSQTPTLTVHESAEGVRLRTRWEGIHLPYTFERTITLELDSACLQFEYTATNIADEPLKVIWSAHPLLGIEPGMHLLVPPSARFHRFITVPGELAVQDEGVQFPFAWHDVDFHALPEPSAAVAVKLWSEPLDAGWATLRARDGELQMRWNVANLPQLAIWMNLGAWGMDGGMPYYNMGLEPCFGAQDSLEEAISRYHVFETIAPHQARRWALEVELVATNDKHA